MNARTCLQFPVDRKVLTTGLQMLTVGLMLLHAASASAGIHTWDVVEVFSSADGSIQYVRLLDRGTTGGETGVGSSSISSSLTSFSWTGSVTPPTNGRSFLIATAAFAALPGAPAPDVIIPPTSTPFFNTAGDSVTFAAVDGLTFGAVPTNGVDSLTETSPTGPQVVGVNTPENYAGVTGTVDARPPSVPSVSLLGIFTTLALVLGIGLASLRRAPIA